MRSHGSTARPRLTGRANFTKYFAKYFAKYRERGCAIPDGRPANRNAEANDATAACDQGWS
jgi:hypothetical protein